MSHSRLLERLHSHVRDARISFVESTHRYYVDERTDIVYTSATTLANECFKPFDADKGVAAMMRSSKWKPGHYAWGLSADEIKALWNRNGQLAAQQGTALHERIEWFYNHPDHAEVQPTHASLWPHFRPDPEDAAWDHFGAFVRDHPEMVPYRTEWRIFDETTRVSGSVDMVFLHPEDGSISIYDWKRTQSIPETNAFHEFAIHPLLGHLPDTKFWHYALQLNIYRVVLEKHYGVRVRDLCLVRLHPTSISYEKIPLPDLRVDVEQLFVERALRLQAEESA